MTKCKDVSTKTSHASTQKKNKILKEIIEVDKQDSNGFCNGDEGGKKDRAQGCIIESISMERRTEILRDKKGKNYKDTKDEA